MNLYKIKYKDCYLNKLKTAFIYTSLLDRASIEIQFCDFYMADIEVIDISKCTTGYIIDDPADMEAII